MRLLLILLFTVVSQPVLSQRVFGHHAAIINHVDLGVLEGDISPGELNGKEIIFKERGKLRNLIIDPRSVTSIQIADVGDFRSFYVEVPVYNEQQELFYLIYKHVFLKVVHRGVPFSLLDGQVEDFRLFFYEDTATKQAILWQCSLGFDEYGKPISVARYKDQFLDLAIVKGVKVPGYYQNIKRRDYNEYLLTEVTKVLNKDAGYTIATAPQPTSHPLPRWSLAIRRGYAFQSNEELDKLNRGPVHEFSVARELHDIYEEWFFRFGLSFSIWQSIATKHVDGKLLQMRSDEFACNPYLMAARQVGKILNYTSYWGIRVGPAFNRYTQKISIDGNIGESEIVRIKKRFSGEFNLNVMLSRNCLIETALGSSLYNHKPSSTYIMAGFVYRWH